MKKVILTIIMLLSLLLIVTIGFSQTTYVKVADRVDYNKYLEYCKDSVTIVVTQYGVINIKPVSILGLDFEIYKIIKGEFTKGLIKDTVWFKLWKCGTKVAPITIGTNQKLVSRYRSVKVTRRLISVADFYANRKTYNKVIVFSN